MVVQRMSAWAHTCALREGPGGLLLDGVEVHPPGGADPSEVEIHLLHDGRRDRRCMVHRDWEVLL